MTKVRAISIALGLLIGVVVGYLNLRFGLKGFFVINYHDTPLVLVVFLGYVDLVDCDCAGFRLRPVFVVLPARRRVHGRQVCAAECRRCGTFTCVRKGSYRRVTGT